MRSDATRVSIRGTLQWAPSPAGLVSEADAKVLVGRALSCDPEAVLVAAVRHGRGLDGLLEMTAFSDPVQSWSPSGVSEIDFVADYEVSK